MPKVKYYLRYIVKAEKYICSMLLVIMLIVCFAAVVMRYVFDKPLLWSEEVILTMLIWFGFLCISIGVFGDSHIAIESIYNIFPTGIKKVLDLLRHTLIVILGCLMVYFGWQVFKINLIKRLPATRWPQAIQYFPMILGGFLTTIYSLVNLTESIIGKKANDKEEEHD